jgi:hypothetical protein
MEVEKTTVSQSRRNSKCAPGVCDPERTQGLKAPAPKGEHMLVNLKGSGVFLAAQIVGTEANSYR